MAIERQNEDLNEEKVSHAASISCEQMADNGIGETSQPISAESSTLYCIICEVNPLKNRRIFNNWCLATDVFMGALEHRFPTGERQLHRWVT